MMNPVTCLSPKMRSRRYVIFTVGFESLWGAETIIGPADTDIFMNGFRGFFVPYCSDRYGRYCVFASPLTLGDTPVGQDCVIEYWSMVEDLPFFDEERVVGYVFGDDCDLVGKVKFIQKTP